MNIITFLCALLFALVLAATCSLVIGAIFGIAFGVGEVIKNIRQRKTKKVVYHYGHYYCPECDADIAQVSFCNLDGSEVKEMYSYCWHCGQKIDWEVEE